MLTNFKIRVVNQHLITYLTVDIYLLYLFMELFRGVGPRNVLEIKYTCFDISF